MVTLLINEFLSFAMEGAFRIVSPPFDGYTILNSTFAYVSVLRLAVALKVMFLHLTPPWQHY